MTLLAAAESLSPREVTTFLLSLAVLLGLARVLGEWARRFKQPVVLGEILAGVLLGPTVFGAVSPDWFAWLFPTGSAGAGAGTYIALEGFILLAATLLLLVVGMDVDLSTVWRQGITALSVSLCGILLPFLIGFTLALSIPHVLGKTDGGNMMPFAIFLGIAMSITALPVIAKILMDLNIARSDMGVLVLSSAMVNDLVGWIGFAVVLALMTPAAGMEAGQAGAAVVNNSDVTTTILLTVGFLAAMISLGRWMVHRSLPYVQAHWQWPGGVLVFVAVIGLSCAALTEWLGIHSIFGAFIAGVAIGDSHHLRQRTRDTIHQFVTNVFAPVFFASIGLRVNFIAHFNLLMVLIVLAAAFAGKVGGCFFGARLCRMSRRESTAVGFGMAAQGVVGIILGQLAYRAGLITEQLLVAIVIMALTTSLIAGPAMQKVLQLRQRRTFKDLLTERNIIIEPKSRNLEDLIYEMSRRGAELTGININAIALAVVDRERIMHTGLPGGLAVPHARIAALSKPCIVLALHKQGIDFDAPDGQPARIVCLLLTSLDDPDSQIEMLSLFAQTFERTATRQAALAANKPTELLAVLNLAQSGEGGEGNV